MLPTLFDRLVAFTAAIADADENAIIHPAEIIMKTLRDRDWRDGHPDFGPYTESKREHLFDSGAEIRGFRLVDRVVTASLRVAAAELEQSAVNERTAEGGLTEALNQWFEHEQKRRGA